MKLLADPLLAGLLIQACGALSLGFLSALYYRSRRRIPLLYWTFGWVCLAAALACLLAGYVFSNQQRALEGAYVFLECCFGLLLVAGCRSFSFQRNLVFLDAVWLIPAALVALALPAWSQGEFRRFFIPQSLILAIFFAVALGVLLRAPRRRGLGFALMCAALGLLTLNFVQYVPIFWRALAQSSELPLGYLRLTSLFHLLLEFVLGMASVLMVEDRRAVELQRCNRDLQRAREHWAGLARTDPLTGALNRHAFRELVGGDGTPGFSGSGSVAIIDLDDLKAFNDQYGHAAGDAILSAVAGALRALVRPDDALFRWGGDEFLVIALGLGEDGLAERLAGLDGLPATLAAAGSERSIRIGTSFGCAAFTSTLEISRALAIADARMYGQKPGRNRPQPGAAAPALPLSTAFGKQEP